ncbi:MAG: hypothetical protein ACM31L_09050 [Actinomycetota bacterium]
MTSEAAAVLLTTHFIDDGIVAACRRLRDEAGPSRRVALFYNRSDDPCPGRPPPADLVVETFDRDDIRLLGYPRKGRRMDGRDVELFALLWHHRHPGSQPVWLIEYDVAFSGRWSVLFDTFAASPADLLATTIHRHAVNPGWDNWASVSTPFGRAKPARLLRAFMPIYRLSRRGLGVLDEAYHEGWAGHYEATVPTILAARGLVLEDIGGDGEFVAPGNRNRFYTNTPAANTLAPGSFVFRPVRLAAGAEPDRLWHPVKPQPRSGGWATGRRDRLGRWASALARAGRQRLATLLGRQR